MPVSPLLVLHVCTAVIGLISGFLSMALRKGSGLHRAAGTVFFVSMLLMSSSAAIIATFVHPIGINRVVSLLTFYLVATAWWAARRRDSALSAFDVVALLFILAVGVMGMSYGFEAASSPSGTKDRMPAALYFVFGSIALLCAISDVRMFLRGSLLGTHRLARHLWRMSLALLIAAMSAYPGQARHFPMWLRETNLLLVPHLLLIGSMLFWLVRVRRSRNRERAAVPQSPTFNLGKEQAMATIARTLLIVVLVAPALVAQENPLSAHSQFMYAGTKAMILGAAEKMPEEHYGFKPTASVRTFGQIIGHVADSQYAFCSRVRGEENPAPKIEENKKTKADLIAALKESFVYCDAAYDAMTDAAAGEKVKLFRREMPKLGILSINAAHMAEHYGNLATYLRMKDLVPPTSEPGFNVQQPKK